MNMNMIYIYISFFIKLLLNDCYIIIYNKNFNIYFNILEVEKFYNNCNLKIKKYIYF